MSNYTKATNFATKDTLPTGNSGKIVKGTEIDDEFNAIASAVSSKADTASPTFTGTPAAPTAASGTNTTQLATTAFVQGEVDAFLTASETLTNKTLTAPVISTISNTGILTLPTSTDTLVGRATTDTLTNKTVNLTSNTLSGTKSQFNTALSDGDFAFASDFENSTGSSGYQKLPGGVTLAWGTITVSSTGSSNNGFTSCSGTASLPLTFTTVLHAFLTHKDADGNFYGSQVLVSSLTTTAITASGNFAYGSSSEPNTVSYLVIGTV